MTLFNEIKTKNLVLKLQILIFYVIVSHYKLEDNFRDLFYWLVQLTYSDSYENMQQSHFV